MNQNATVAEKIDFKVRVATRLCDIKVFFYPSIKFGKRELLLFAYHRSNPIGKFDWEIEEVILGLFANSREPSLFLCKYSKLVKSHQKIPSNILG